MLQRICFRAARPALRDYPLSTRCWRRISSIAAPTTPPGSATTRARRCCSRRAAATALALACSAPWHARSAGFVGVSDGWQDLHEHCALTWNYQRRGRRQCRADRRDRLLPPMATANRARARLRPARRKKPAHRARSACTTASMPPPRAYVASWQDWQARLLAARSRRAIQAREHLSHQHGGAAHASSPIRFPAASSPASRSPGASARATTISAAIIWSGRAIWSRRRAACWPPALSTTRAACCAICARPRRPTATGRRTAGSTARAYWTGIQMDECAFPILLVDVLCARGRI